MFKFWTFCVLEPLFWGLGATYDVHLRLIGKRVVDFLLVLIELFFARCYGRSVNRRFPPVDSKFQVEGVAPTNHSSSQITRLNGLSYGIKIWTDLSSVLLQSTRLTDRRTERQADFLVASPRWHSMQRRKRCCCWWCCCCCCCVCVGDAATIASPL